MKKLFITTALMLLPTLVISKPFINNEKESFKVQLQGGIDPNLDYDIFFIDGTDNTKNKIDNIKSKGKTVICYLSAGSFEDWREDKDKFQKSEIGNPLGEWPGEYWLDIRSENVKQIMSERIDYLAEKGCDGVDPDNINVHTQHSGFNITKEEQIEYNKFLALKIKERGMIAGLKNGLDMIPELIAYYDFAINEECNIYKECNNLKPFIENNKPVFNIEYDYYYNTPEKLYQLCYKSEELGFNTIVANLALDGKYYRSCSKLNL